MMYVSANQKAVSLNLHRYIGEAPDAKTITLTFERALLEDDQAGLYKSNAVDS
jgi:hypothetical protein